MYRLTTDTGLDIHTPDPVAAAEALRRELQNNIAVRPVNWTVDLNGALQENGGINAHGVDHDHDEFIDETIHDLLQRLTSTTQVIASASQTVGPRGYVHVG